jgi:broad specificity phosphatase PhoE
MKLFIIRHGDPNYAIDSLTERGWLEADLLRDRLVNRIYTADYRDPDKTKIHETITKVYLSPLGRAQDTAKHFLYTTGIKAETKEWLKEFPYPAFEPLKKYGIGDKDANSCPWDLDLRLFTMFSQQLSDNEHWFEHEIYTTTGAGEYALMVFREFDKLLSENGLDRRGYEFRVNDNYDENANIAIFCHMGLGSLLLAHIAHIAPPLYWQMIRVMPTSVSTVVYSKTRHEIEGKPAYQSKIFMIGDTTHLEDIGLTYRG